MPFLRHSSFRADTALTNCHSSAVQHHNVRRPTEAPTACVTHNALIFQFPSPGDKLALQWKREPEIDRVANKPASQDRMMASRPRLSGDTRRHARGGSCGPDIFTGFARDLSLALSGGRGSRGVASLSFGSRLPCAARFLGRLGCLSLGGQHPLMFTGSCLSSGRGYLVRGEHLYRWGGRGRSCAANRALV